MRVHAIEPKCPKCKSLLRPDVVWFDEELDEGEVKRIERFLAGGRCDVVLVIGTMATFRYIVEWARRASRASRLATVTIRGKAAEALRVLVARALKRGHSTFRK